MREAGVDPDNEEAVKLARLTWQALPLLSSTEIRDTSRAAMIRALGPEISGDTPFPASIWYGGATDTYDGYRFKGTIADFVTCVLEARASEVAPKRCGWVVTPTTCVDGRRVNASTTAVHALNLDCDGRGEPDRLLTRLAGLDLAHILYQSGGWNPATPKWHALIPLARPFDTSSPEKIAAWKSAYNTARVVFGSLAELSGEGFDPAVETPCVPVFITERRVETDPPRKVWWKPGRALDLDALIVALPTPPREVVSNPLRERVVEPVVLDDERLERIVEVLARATINVPSDRRTLYLALPGALLDRGLDPDDVRAIVEAVSERYPRPDPQRHSDHVAAAKSTIACFERGENYTRIGTLVSSWPGVVAAIDEVLPNPIIAATEAMLANMQTSRTGGVAPPPSLGDHQTTAMGTAALPGTPEPEAVRAFELGDLVARLKRQRAKKRRSKDIHQQVRSVILEALLSGDDLTPYTPEGKLVNGPDGRPIDRDEALAVTIRMISYTLPVGTVFDAVQEIMRPSLFKMLQPGETVDELLRRAKNRFHFTVGKRHERDEKQRTEDVAAAERKAAWVDRQQAQRKAGNF